MNEQNARLLTAMGVGIPLGQIVVWILETFYLAAAIPSEVAIAFGTVLGAIVHVGVRVAQCIFFKRKSNQGHAIEVTCAGDPDD